MSDDLARLLLQAKTAKPTPEELEGQRRSFALGNAAIRNERVTREVVDKAAEERLRESREH